MQVSSFNALNADRKMTLAEIITIGDEILIGQTVDTNSAWMGRELNKAGVAVNRITSIQDKETEIINALDSSLSLADIILITGGLGPTSDDITKQTLCKYFNTSLIFSEEVFNEVDGRMKRRGFPMNEKNRGQAYVPESCTVLMNKAGTAPGMLFRQNKKVIISMPGVPSEMIFLMSEYVLPLISKEYPGGAIVHRNFMTYGVGEAVLAERLENFEKELPAEVKLAYLPAFGLVKLRLTARGSSKDELNRIVEKEAKKLYGIIPDAIYAEGEVSLEEAIGNLLKESNKTMCTAESCTGGTIASMITAIPGASEWYKGSVIAYSNEVKASVLGVDPALIAEFGAVSRETALAMASGAREVLRTDYSVAVTGVAGPTGGTEEKPVGTVWISVATPDRVVAEKHTFGDARTTNISRFSATALNMLRKQIISK